MIIYWKGVGGFRLLLQIHGSALYRACGPGLFSVIIYLILLNNDQYRDELTHPYASGVLISSVVLILVFRANHGYQRYWEACGAVHLMMSKWLDATVTTASFHMQCKHFDKIKPISMFEMDTPPPTSIAENLPEPSLIKEPSAKQSLRGNLMRVKSITINQAFKDDPENDTAPSADQPLNKGGSMLSESNLLNFRDTLQRSQSISLRDDKLNSSKRNLRANLQRCQSISINEVYDEGTKSHPSGIRGTLQRSLSRKNIINEKIEQEEKRQNPNVIRHTVVGNLSTIDILNDYEDTLMTSAPATELGRVDGGWGLLFGSNSYEQTSTPTASWASGVTPSLFLQELAHLSSLCVAVAFCSVRSNLYNTVLTTEPYVPRPRTPFPHVNTINYYFDKSQDTLAEKCKIWLAYWFGLRTANDSAHLHAECPMPVLGGVSEAEKKLLSQARGGAAKTTLAWYWLSEFVTREHLNGSTGSVAPPIVSRIHQFLSDGMLGYNTARKISYIPFPFAHAQISIFYVPVLVLFIPLTIEQFTNSMWLGITLVFFTVTTFAGVQEVACELENPFRNFPNDIPLRTLLAMYNEALIQMCTGYHPDMRWEVKKMR